MTPKACGKCPVYQFKIFKLPEAITKLGEENHRLKQEIKKLKEVWNGSCLSKGKSVQGDNKLQMREKNPEDLQEQEAL